MFACLYAPDFPSLLEQARQFSPLIEQACSNTVILAIDGLEHLFGSPHEIASALWERTERRASVAIASHLDAAVHAARGLPGITIIAPGEEANILGPLPLEILEPSPEIQETLDRWGIRTFRDLAALPEIGVAERLGAEGIRLRKLARGESSRPLHIPKPSSRFEESMELDHALVLLEPLLFVLARFLGEICAQLEAHGLATNELILTLRLENRTEHIRPYRLPVPMRNARTFLKLMQLDLEATPLEAPIVAVVLRAEPVDPRAAQGGLFLPPAPEPEKLELTLARIAKLVGKENAGTPELLDTHRPDAVRINASQPAVKTVSRTTSGSRARFHLGFRTFRPPLRAQVEAPSGYPTRVDARGMHGKVNRSAGPWRTSGDWWRQEIWDRDEWDVQLAHGAVYRIFQDRHSGAWFVAGYYD